MAEPMQTEQANGLLHKRKLVLRLDDGSLIGPVETLLPGTGGHGGPSAVLLDFEAACRTGRAGQKELDRLDRLIRDFQARVSGLHSIAPKDLKQRNPYTNDVSDRMLCSTPAWSVCQHVFLGMICTAGVECSCLDIVSQSCQQQLQLQQQQQTHRTWDRPTHPDLSFHAMITVIMLGCHGTLTAAVSRLLLHGLSTQLPVDTSCCPCLSLVSTPAPTQAAPFNLMTVCCYLQHILCVSPAPPNCPTFVTHHNDSTSPCPCVPPCRCLGPSSGSDRWPWASCPLATQPCSSCSTHTQARSCSSSPQGPWTSCQSAQTCSTGCTRPAATWACCGTSL